MSIGCDGSASSSAIASASSALASPTLTQLPRSARTSACTASLSSRDKARPSSFESTAAASRRLFSTRCGLVCEKERTAVYAPPEPSLAAIHCGRGRRRRAPVKAAL
eukprot:272683-Pleurochrysis_carterae.AAC.1